MKKGPFIFLIAAVLVSFFFFPNNFYILFFAIGVTVLLSIENLKMKLLGPAYSDDVGYFVSWNEYVKTREKKFENREAKKEEAATTSGVQ